MAASIEDIAESLCPLPGGTRGQVLALAAMIRLAEQDIVAYYALLWALWGAQQVSSAPNKGPMRAAEMPVLLGPDEESVLGHGREAGSNSATDNQALIGAISRRIEVLEVMHSEAQAKVNAGIEQALEHYLAHEGVHFSEEVHDVGAMRRYILQQLCHPLVEGSDSLLQQILSEHFLDGRSETTLSHQPPPGLIQQHLMMSPEQGLAALAPWPRYDHSKYHDQLAEACAKRLMQRKECRHQARPTPLAFARISRKELQGEIWLMAGCLDATGAIQLQLEAARIRKYQRHLSAIQQQLTSGANNVNFFNTPVPRPY